MPQDLLTGKQVLGGGLLNTGFKVHSLDKFYLQLVQSTDRLIPFYREFFTYYKMNKRVVVLDLLTKIRRYDETLF